jgi:hypothetical protein
MPAIQLILIVCSVALVAILIRALITGKLHSQYAVTHRDKNPGGFWALWFVLLLPLIPIALVVARLGIRR